MYLIDGGISKGLPVDLVKILGAKVILGVDLYSSQLPDKMDSSSLAIMERTYNLLMSKLSVYQEEDYKTNTLVLRPKTGKGIQMFAFDKGKEFILAGENETRKKLKKIKELMK